LRKSPIFGNNLNKSKLLKKLSADRIREMQPSFGAEYYVFRFAEHKYEINKYGILPLVLYGCGTWSLTLREEWRLRVFENRVLREYLALSGTR
jgi:hypothetical protein